MAAQIIITLLTTRRTRQTVQDLDVSIGVAPDGYTVVAGENLSTEVQVNYPEAYRALNCYVHMKNSRGEYATITFAGDASAKTFAIPSTMTLAGNTVFTFYAENTESTEKTVWVPVIIPITATGVDYVRVAQCNPDVVIEAIRRLNALDDAEAARVAAEEERRANETARQTAEEERVAAEQARKEELNNKLNKSDIVHTTGQSTTEVMSQKATTDEIDMLSKDVNSLLSLTNGAITAANLADGAVTSSKLANLMVGEQQIRIAVTDDTGMEHGYLLRHKGETIGTADLAKGAVTTAKLADGAVTAAKLADGAVQFSALYLDDINMPIAVYLTNTDPAQYPVALTAGAGRMFTTKYGDVFISEAAVTGPDDVLLLYDAAAAMRKVRTVADIEVVDPITITDWTEGKKTNFGDAGKLTDDADMKISGELPTVVGVTYTFTCDMPGAYVINYYIGEYPLALQSDGSYAVQYTQEGLDYDLGYLLQSCMVVAPIGATVTYNVGPVAIESVHVTLTNRHEYRFSGGGTFHLQINKPTVTDAELMSSVHFTSPALAASISYADTILWHGDDIAGGVFVPEANTRYRIDFRYDGAYMTAEVTAYTLPTA